MVGKWNVSLGENSTKIVISNEMSIGSIGIFMEQQIASNLSHTLVVPLIAGNFLYM